MNDNKKRAVLPLILITLIEILILGTISVLIISRRHDVAVLNPDLSTWQSTYTSYENDTWQGNESVYPADEAPGTDIELLYGPYFALPAGNYSVSIDYECTEDQTFAVYSAQNGNAVFAHEPEILPADNTSRTVHFTLLQNVNDLEIRFHYNGIGMITIKHINVVSSTFLLREILLSLLIIFVLVDICLITYRKYQGKESREPWIDVCRGIGILFILLGHTDPPFKWLIFGFHVPLFFILSGYLYKERSNTKEYLAKLYKRYIIPYFVLSGINLFICLIRMKIEGGFSTDLLKLYLNGIVYSNDWLPNCVPLWFLPALFLTMAGIHFLHKTPSDNMRAMIVLVCLVMAIGLDYFDCPLLPWGLGQAVLGIVLAETGNIMNRISLIQIIINLKRAQRIGLLLLLLICGCDAIYYNYQITEQISSMLAMRYGHFSLWFIGEVLVSIVLMSVSALLCQENKRMKKGFLWKPLAVLGAHTILFFAFDFCMNDCASALLTVALHYDPWYFVFPVKFLLLIGVSYILLSRDFLVSICRKSGK